MSFIFHLKVNTYSFRDLRFSQIFKFKFPVPQFSLLGIFWECQFVKGKFLALYKLDINGCLRKGICLEIRARNG